MNTNMAARWTTRYAAGSELKAGDTGKEADLRTRRQKGYGLASPYQEATTLECPIDAEQTQIKAGDTGKEVCGTDNEMSCEF